MPSEHNEIRKDMATVSGDKVTFEAADAATLDQLRSTASALEQGDLIMIEKGAGKEGSAAMKIPMESLAAYVGSAATSLALHPPTIVDGCWAVWNATDGQYETTGVKAAGKSPYVNTDTGTWMVYDDTSQAYTDSGVLASGGEYLTDDEIKEAIAAADEK